MIDINLYDRLFKIESPDENKEVNFKTYINENSLIKVKNVCAESSIKNVSFDNYYQFQRKGYFKLDSKNEKLTFNRTVTLRDTWRS